MTKYAYSIPLVKLWLLIEDARSELDDWERKDAKAGKESDEMCQAADLWCRLSNIFIGRIHEIDNA